MARPSATDVFLLLLLSLITVAHCRTLESEPATDASTDETTSVAVDGETGPPKPTVIPAPAVEHDGFLRLPSHRLHRHHPCRHGLFHRHLWWARHRTLFGDAEAEKDEVKPVAEPELGRSLPDSDSEGELVRNPFRDGEDHDDDTAAVKRWRMFRHGPRHHHHHHDEDDDEEDHAQEEEGVVGMKRFRHHDDDEEEEEEKEKKMRKLIHFHHHRHHDEDEDEKVRKPFHHADDGDDELEEMVRRFRKAIMRRRFHHGRRFFRHHHHGRRHHADEAHELSDGEQQQEGGGVMTWIKGLMNRF